MAALWIFICIVFILGIWIGVTSYILGWIHKKWRPSKYSEEDQVACFFMAIGWPVTMPVWLTCIGIRQLFNLGKN